MSTMRPGEYECRACKKKFDSLGDLEKHILVRHHQIGDIPSESDAGKQ